MELTIDIIKEKYGIDFDDDVRHFQLLGDHLEWWVYDERGRDGKTIVNMDIIRGHPNCIDVRVGSDMQYDIESVYTFKPIEKLED